MKVQHSRKDYRKAVFIEIGLYTFIHKELNSELLIYNKTRAIYVF